MQLTSEFSQWHKEFQDEALRMLAEDKDSPRATLPFAMEDCVPNLEAPSPAKQSKRISSTALLAIGTISALVSYAGCLTIQTTFFGAKAEIAKMPANDFRSTQDLETKISKMASVMDFLVERVSQVSSPPAVESSTESEVPEESPDLGGEIVTIGKDSVKLRANPTKDSAPVMNVARGTRLVVAEKLGEWIKVFAPSGELAYVRSDLVQE